MSVHRRKPTNATGKSVRIYRFNSIEIVQEQPYHSCRPLSPPEDLAGKEAGMRRDDLMKPDLVSEVVLISSGMLIVVILILTLVAAVTRIALLP